MTTSPELESVEGVTVRVGLDRVGSQFEITMRMGKRIRESVVRGIMGVGFLIWE